MTMDFAKAATRVRNLLAPSKPADLSASALTPDSLRDRVIRETEATNPRFHAAVDQVPTIEYERDGVREQYEWDTFPEVVRDFARAAYGFDEPDVLSQDRMQPRFRFGREVTNAAVRSEPMRDLRPYSSGNELEATAGAQAFTDYLQQEGAEQLAEHIAHSEEIGEAQDQQTSAEQAFENLRNQAQQERDEQGIAQPDTSRALDQAWNQVSQANDKLEGLMQGQQQAGMPEAVARVAREAAEAAAERARLVHELPGTEDGRPQNMAVDDVLALAEKWAMHKELAEVAKRLGRLIRSLRFKRMAVAKHVRVQPVGVEAGNDIPSLLPTEAARGRAQHPILRALWVRDWAERRLLQFNKEGETPAGEGPLVAVRDGSGSMGVDFGGVSRRTWACSLCLAMRALMAREGRDFAGVEFGSGSELKRWMFPKGEQVDPAQVLDYATHFFGGGTSTRAGMNEALQIIRDAPKFTTADILLIGDGADTFTPADARVRDELRTLGVRIHGIAIAVTNNAYMEEMCDEVTYLASLADEDAATTALANGLT